MKSDGRPFATILVLSFMATLCDIAPVLCGIVHHFCQIKASPSFASMVWNLRSPDHQLVRISVVNGFLDPVNPRLLIRIVGCDNDGLDQVHNLKSLTFWARVVHRP